MITDVDGDGGYLIPDAVAKALEVDLQYREKSVWNFLERLQPKPLKEEPMAQCHLCFAEKQSEDTHEEDGVQSEVVGFLCGTTVTTNRTWDDDSEMWERRDKTVSVGENCIKPASSSSEQSSPLCYQQMEGVT